MKQIEDILNELKEISPLIVQIGCGNLFTVPEGYFETVSDTVLACLRDEGNLVYADKKRDGTIPENYFDGLAGSILSKIKDHDALSAAEELKQLSPLLARLNKVNPYKLPEKYFETLQPVLSQTGTLLKAVNTIQPFEVPANYFESLPTAILNKLQERPVAKIVRMPKRNAWIKYAAAAVITGAFSLGIFKYTNNPGVQIKNPVAQLEPSIETGKNMDDKKFDEILKGLTEDDITQYLEKNGSEADIASLTSTLEDNVLPKQEDYLLDNATLDNFLKEINSKSSEN